MKRKLQFVLNASAASILACSAMAQEPPLTTKERLEDTRERASTARRADRLNGAAKASEIIGLTVNNYQDVKLGKVEELAVDVESGRIVQVILSSGGFLGINDSLTAVPPGALHHDAAQKVLHLNSTKEKLKDAPKFEMAKWAEYSDASHLTNVYGYYGEESYYTFVHAGDEIQEGQRNPDGTSAKDRIHGERRFQIPAARLSQIQKASQIIGTGVSNLQDEKLGKVENLLLDLPAGRIVAVIISSGGFLGMGDELSAVPPSAFRFSPDRATLQLDASKAMLTEAPHFKANQWPDFAVPSYADGVYRAYRIEPYFSTNLTSAADHTTLDVRDRDGRTLTPLHQGTSKADIATTAQIRKEIIARKNLSVTAQNVKVITIDGRVTLRGSVNTVEERRLIAEIADRAVTPGNVDNQLEVKLTRIDN